MKIAIASGKGGTGKTFVSTNLFWVAKLAGMSVTLIDCDAEEPNVREYLEENDCCSENVFQQIPVIDTSRCTFCGKCFEYCNYNAIVFLQANRFIRIVEDLCHDCGACSYACRDGAITEKKKLLGTVNTISKDPGTNVVEACTEVGVYSPVPVIKKALAHINSHEITLLDAPPGISCPFITTVAPADYVVLVAEPTPFGLNDLILSAETLRKLEKPFGVVINKAGLGNNDTGQWLESNKIPLLLEIPFDREIARLFAEGILPVKENIIFATLFKKLLNRILTPTP